MPFPFMAAASLGSGLISGISGLIQKGKAKKMIEDNPFPEMAIPEAISENQRIAERLAGGGLPAEQYNLAKQNIARNTNTAISQANDRKSGLAAIGGIQTRANDASMNLDATNAAARQQNQRTLMQQNNVMGGWQNNVWDWNKRQQYIQKAAAARAMMGAGNQNLNIGVDKALSGGLMGADYLTNNGSYNPGWFMGSNNTGQQSTGGSNTPSDFATYLAIQQYLKNNGQ